LNARALAIWSASALSIALTTANPVYRALVVVVALNVLLTLRRPGARLKPLMIAVATAGVLATAVTFAVSHTGAHQLFALPAQIPVLGGAFTLESLVFGAVSGLGVAAAVLAVAPMSLVMQPHELVDALPRALARSGAAVATAINLLPAVARSATEIREAQRMRGLQSARLSAVRDIAVPVVLTAVEDSVRLAEAMESRAYGGGAARTHFAEPRWTLRDVVLGATAVAAAAAVIVMRASGTIADWYPFPALTIPAVNPVAVAACLVLSAPALMRR